MLRSILAFLLCLIFCHVYSAGAQTAPTPSANKSAAAPAKVDTPADLSKEALVVEKYSQKIRYESDGTGTRETYARVQIHADAGVKDMAVLTFTYTAASQTTSIEFVRVIKPDGKIVETPSYNAQDLPADVTREAPMYSDIHQVHVAVKGLGVGDTLEYKVTLHIVKPDVPGQFWLTEKLDKSKIYLDESIDLDLPSKLPVHVVSGELQPTVTKAGERVLYRWATQNLSHPDPDAPAKPRKERKPDIQISTFKSWEDVGGWYKSLAAGQAKVTPAIQARADGDIKGLTRDEDKINAIFNDVALHIHYISLSFGIGRYQPHEADEVLSNEYGDCKDKHTLLAAMLKAEGYEAWPVLISSGTEIDEQTPSPAQFDHVITLMTMNGKLLWMDSTEEVSPVGVLLSPLRDKQALTIPSNMPAYLVKTPDNLPFESKATFITEATLSDAGLLKGKIQQSYYGETELLLRSAYRKTSQSDWQKLTQQVSYALGFMGEVSDLKVSDVEKIGAPLDISYSYTRENYSDFENLSIMPALPPISLSMAKGSKETKPVEDIQLGSPGVELHKCTIHLPKGWDARIPDNVHLVEDWAEFQSTYVFTAGDFITERKLILKKNKVPLADWDKYLEFRNKIFEDQFNTTKLTNPESKENPRKVALNDYNSRILDAYYKPVAANIRELNSAFEILRTEPDAISTSLQNALEIINKQNALIDTAMSTAAADNENALHWTQAVTYAWCLRGWAELQKKNLPTAESFLKAAWSLGQDQLSGYLLGRVYEELGQQKNAAHQYELAEITDIPGPLGGLGLELYEVSHLIHQHYKKITGNELRATALKNGSYNGSLHEEMDKFLEVHRYIKQTNLTGEAYYILQYEGGKAVKVTMVKGGKGFDTFTHVLQTRPFEQIWPAESKTVLQREVRMVCSPYGGCDAYLYLPTKIILNNGQRYMRVIN
jgi:hypothetical protein